MTYTYTPEGYKEPNRAADKCVLIDGPYSNATARSDWDEFPEWHVGVVDNDGEPIDTIYTLRNYDAAINLGSKIARDHDLELVNDAGYA